MKLTTILFAFAAVGGMTMAVMRMSGTELPPTWMAVGHGLIAATAIASLIIVALQQRLPDRAKAALAFFIVAALAGAYIFVNYHLEGQPLPIPLTLVHGGVAVTGFALLVATVYLYRAKSRVR